MRTVLELAESNHTVSELAESNHITVWKFSVIITFEQCYSIFCFLIHQPISKRFSLFQYISPFIFSYRSFFSTFPIMNSSKIQTQLLKWQSLIFPAFCTQRRRPTCLQGTSLPALTQFSQLQESTLQDRILLFLGCG